MTSRTVFAKTWEGLEEAQKLLDEVPPPDAPVSEEERQEIVEKVRNQANVVMQRRLEQQARAKRQERAKSKQARKSRQAQRRRK